LREWSEAKGHLLKAVPAWSFVSQKRTLMDALANLGRAHIRLDEEKAGHAAIHKALKLSKEAGLR